MINIICRGVAVGFSFIFSSSFVVYADEISVKEFVPGTVISSADVNNNFDVLAKESNENDARLASLEGAQVTSSSSTRTLVFAGYTTGEFVRENYGDVANFYTTSLHCKQEFGDQASILTSSAIEHFVFHGNSFVPPSDSDALILFDSGELVVTMSGSSSSSSVGLVSRYWDSGHSRYGFGVVTPTGRIGTDRIEGSQNITTHSVPIRVGCVILQQ